jgi:glutathione-regulated potassium-efflux system ancillary protein KefF
MSTDARILVLYAHPAPRRSRVHRALADAARDLPGVKVLDLYETYPDFYIDAPHERAQLEASELLVFLHPIRWYGMPSLLKEWTDTVFEPGWAYARNRGALVGKGFWLVASTGSGEEEYQPGGLHGRPFADFLAPFEQGAALCGMRWQPPLILHGASQADNAQLAAYVATFRQGLVDWPGPGGGVGADATGKNANGK